MIVQSSKFKVQGFLDDSVARGEFNEFTYQVLSYQWIMCIFRRVMVPG